jgi:hypothetical protein
MTRAGLRLRTAAVALAGLAAASVTAPGLPGAAASTPAGPQIKLIAAQNSIKLARYGHIVYLDPGIWTASLGAALEFDVQRPGYASPLTLTQVIHLPGGGVQQVPFPGTLIGRVPTQLRRFLQITVATTKGKVLDSSKVGFCPDSYDPERASPDSPATSPYPQECVGDPFPRSLVWGVAQGWAVDPMEENGVAYRLNLGTYRVTETILAPYTKLLHIAAADATASVKVTVVKPGAAGTQARPAVPAGRALPTLPQARTLADPPVSSLPDLIPLPSWGISVHHIRAAKTHPASDQVDFGATVGISGNGPLDVEGFRSHGSPTMKAYQYFWENGQVIGRARAGTMGFDTEHGHNHWHFQQFAQYSLLNSAHQLAVPSRKVGFCIAPTDPVNLLLPAAQWQPASLGFASGQCGLTTALWVREMLPVGWADTYFQSVAGQSFNITSLRNGTYYIEIVANPEHVLHETDPGNDVSLRKVILGGTKGHRTVRVPAYDGIDPEG